MTSPIDLISLQDALALVRAIPDVVSPDGDAATKRRALAFENTRDGEGWRGAFPRESVTTLASGKQVREGLAPIQFRPEQLAGQFVEMVHPDGRRFRIPVILLQAAAGWLYVALENGTVVPAPLPEAE